MNFFNAYYVLPRKIEDEITVVGSHLAAAY